VRTAPASDHLSHIGLCVRELDRSLRFYCDGLGFTKADPFPLDDTFAAGLEAGERTSAVSQFIRRADVTIELLAWTVPGVRGEPSSSRTQVGLTHLSFLVDDIDAAATRLVELGGQLLPATRTTIDGVVDLVFLTDPDGTRVELMRTA